MVDESNKRKEDCLAGRCLDDGGFANTCGVEVDIRPFFSSFFLHVKIQKLDYVADKIRKLPIIDDFSQRLSLRGSYGAECTGSIPVVFNLVQIVLDFFFHSSLLMGQALEFALHDPHIVI